MQTIGIIAGSTRPGRRAHQLAAWVADEGRRHLGDDVALEIVDLAEVDLPLLDEQVPAMMGQYAGAHTRAWAATVDRLDGFVWVVPEYNHSFPAATKNAIDFLYREWNDKAAGIVSYGVQGGQRAGEHLRAVLAEMKVATVRMAPAINVFEAFDDAGAVAVSPQIASYVRQMFDEVVAWSGALQGLRAAAPVSA